MPKSIRIAPQAVPSTGQAITFVLAIGSVRQARRLQTGFRTPNQAFSYFYKHRTQFEQIARGRLARGRSKTESSSSARASTNFRWKPASSQSQWIQSELMKAVAVW